MGINLLLLGVMFLAIVLNIGPAFSLKCYRCDDRTYMGLTNISCDKPGEQECEKPSEVCMVQFHDKRKEKITFSMCDSEPPYWAKKLFKTDRLTPSGQCFCQTDLCNDFTCGSSSERSAESSNKSSSCQLTPGIRMTGLPVLSGVWLFTQL